MNIPDKAEVLEKHGRILEFFDKTGYEAMVIGRQDNFAWYTCGGNNRVVITSELGVALLVITREHTYCITHVMDGLRVFEDELQGLQIEPVFMKWHMGSCAQKAAELTKGLKTITDMPVEGAYAGVGEIYGLHYPLTDKEIEKYRWIGAKTEEILRAAADEIRPGISEREIEAMFQYQYGKADMDSDVILVGSDERVTRYRHPNASDKKVEKLVLLHTAVRKWGLHANVTRMVYFGDSLPEDMAYRYDTASKLEAQAISMCVEGAEFHGILEERKRLLSEAGFAGEWEKHFPGGITGYLLCDAGVCASRDRVVSINQAYDWFITITGVKVEELSVNTTKGREILSAAGKWPLKKYAYKDDSYLLPEIMMK